MSLFARLFRKPPSLAPTLPAVTEKPAAAPPDERIVAIETLSDPERLMRLAGLAAVDATATVTVAAAGSPDETRAARRRLAQLVEAGALPMATLTSLGDPTLFERACLEDPSSRVRQVAAESLVDSEQWRRVLKLTRNKDKGVYKIVKRKCEALDAEARGREEAAAAAAVAVDSLCAALDSHSRRSFDAAYIETLGRLEGRWQASPHPPSEAQRERAERAIDRAREVIAAQLRCVAEEAVRQAQRDAEDAAQSQARAEADDRHELARLRDEETERAAASERAAAEGARAAREQLMRRIGGLLRQANGALHDGNTQRAAALRAALQQKLPTDTPLPAHLTRGLQQLDETLARLREWKEHAVAPKRTELIEEMESLVGSTEEPHLLAERIKALQADWRTMGKGLEGDATAETERFRQAAQAAYAPCREYFETQATARRENLERRRQVLDRLTTFETSLGEGELDGRLAATVLREAPREWRSHSPVERGALRPLQREFDAALVRLDERLRTWQEANAARKTVLIGHARELLSRTDAAAIDAIKTLQAQWKLAGPAANAVDQSLWIEFRGICDEVFERRAQAHAEQVASRGAQADAAVALCESAERAANATEFTGAEAAEFTAAFEALGELPRGEARELKRRFDRALAALSSAAARRREVLADETFLESMGEIRREHARQWAERQNAPMSTADVEARSWRLRALCIRCEIASDLPSPAEDESLRREYQVQRLVQGMGQGVRAAAADWDQWRREWQAIGAVEPTLHEEFATRFLRAWAARPRETR